MPESSGRISARLPESAPDGPSPEPTPHSGKPEQKPHDPRFGELDRHIPTGKDAEARTGPHVSTRREKPKRQYAPLPLRKQALPPELSRAVTQAARAIRKHFPLSDRLQAHAAARLFERVLVPCRTGRPARADVTAALRLEAAGITRKEIYHRLGKTTTAQQHALREAMRQRKFRRRKHQTGV